MWQLYQTPSHCETIPPEEKWIEYRCREGTGEEQKEEGENKTKNRKREERREPLENIQRLKERSVGTRRNKEEEGGEKK